MFFFFEVGVGVVVREILMVMAEFYVSRFVLDTRASASVALKS